MATPVTPQVLTAAKVRAAARKAYREGKLTAQHPDPENRVCIYDGGDGYHCAIGAALSKKTLRALRASHSMSCTVRALWNKGFVDIPEQDRAQVMQIQVEHDNWASAAALTEDPAKVVACRDVFLKAINLKPPKDN